MKYAVEQRLRMIDFLISHYNFVGRKQLVDYFGISEPQATRDFRAYKELAPCNLVFDEVTKSYIKANTFKRVFG